MKAIEPIYIALPIAIALAGTIAHRTLALSNPMNKPLPTPSFMITSGIIEPVGDRSVPSPNIRERPVG